MNIDVLRIAEMVFSKLLFNIFHTNLDGIIFFTEIFQIYRTHYDMLCKLGCK